ncbi:MAG: hypothetical protein OEX12_08900 [Gammaproteobacteria bacterium]|nr:hypothetical protein [Gammaproteobacteria bacterium]
MSELIALTEHVHGNVGVLFIGYTLLSLLTFAYLGRRTLYRPIKHYGRVLRWAHSKNIISHGTSIGQIEKTLEEAEEVLEVLQDIEALKIECMKKGYQWQDSQYYADRLAALRHKLMDEYGDVFATLIIGLEIEGLSINECLDVAVTKLESRAHEKTSLVDGVLIREKTS